MEVPGNSPPTRSKKKTFLLLSFTGLIGGSDHSGLGSPYGALSVDVSDYFFLIVCILASKRTLTQFPGT